jgi:hypothetical protein
LGRVQRPRQLAALEQVVSGAEAFSAQHIGSPRGGEARTFDTSTAFGCCAQVEVEGELAEGKRFKSVVTPSSGSPMTFTPVVGLQLHDRRARALPQAPSRPFMTPSHARQVLVYQPPAEVKWRGQLLNVSWIFQGEHYIRFEAREGGGTRLVHGGCRGNQVRIAQSPRALLFFIGQLSPVAFLTIAVAGQRLSTHWGAAACHKLNA